jgi:hypothetical protein
VSFLSGGSKSRAQGYFPAACEGEGLGVCPTAAHRGALRGKGGRGKHFPFPLSPEYPLRHPAPVQLVGGDRRGLRGHPGRGCRMSVVNIDEVGGPYSPG